jgi:hypothetical protein
MSKIFCFAANGPIWAEFRLKQKYLGMLLVVLAGVLSAYYPIVFVS